MATTAAELKRIQTKIKKLETQVAQLRRVLREQGLLPDGKGAVSRKGAREMSERERVREILRRAGVTREMTPEEKQLAAEWDALSEEEKREVEETLRRLHLDPPLSQLIHEMRR